MPEVAFVLSPTSDWYLRELAGTLQYELAAQGVPSSLHLVAFPPPQPERVYALLAPDQYVALEGERALPEEAILRRTMFVCALHPDGIDRPENLELLRRAGAMFELQGRSMLALRRLGIPAQWLRPGYSEALGRFDPDAERPIDVVSLGPPSRRRAEHLSRCARVLTRHDRVLEIGDGTQPDPRALLARAKIVLNFHSGEDMSFEWLPALAAIHAGAVLVSEHSAGLAPLVPGEHLLVASPESLPFVVESALRDPERLRQIRTQAHERIRASLPFALSVAVLRATAVELIGQPLPP